jgi:hypothetical protein
LLGAKLKLVSIEWMKVGLANTTKSVKTLKIWFLFEELLKRQGKIQHFGWKTIDKKGGS